MTVPHTDRNIKTHLDLRIPDSLIETLRGETVIPEQVRSLLGQDEQRAFPTIAKSPDLIRQIHRIVHSLPTSHSIVRRDSRFMEDVPDESIHLVLTSPPYWTLKQYVGSNGQLGDIEDYGSFLLELDRIWQHIYRVLVPGGRLVIVIGDVCVSRRKYGRHLVFPLHASIQEHCRAIGFDNLSPIIWYKISNASLEASGNGTVFLGKPYEPGGVIKNDIEFILMQRKKGAYRNPSIVTRVLSVISEEEHRRWFQQVWDMKGASTKHHPAPYPLELAERLIRMFSFVGDTVLDPFLGAGTTSLAALSWGRNSIGFEVEEKYHMLALTSLHKANTKQSTLRMFEEM